MNHLLKRIAPFDHRSRPPQAARVLFFAVSLFLSASSPAAAQDSLTVSERLAASKRGIWEIKTDTVAVKKDTTQLLLVTAVPDTTAKPPDTVRVQEAHPQDSPIDRGFLIRTSDGSAELRIRGSVRLNGIYDFNGLQSQSTFT